MALHQQRIADELVKKALRDGSGGISYQVVQEVLNVSTRKLGPRCDAVRHLAGTLEPLWRIQPSAELFRLVLSLRTRYKFSFCDSLIVATALSAGCTLL